MFLYFFKTFFNETAYVILQRASQIKMLICDAATAKARENLVCSRTIFIKIHPTDSHFPKKPNIRTRANIKIPKCTFAAEINALALRVAVHKRMRRRTSCLYELIYSITFRFINVSRNHRRVLGGTETTHPTTSPRRPPPTFYHRRLSALRESSSWLCT